MVPLRNESGTLQIDGDNLADHFVRHLQNATNIEMLPVNRTLEAMEALHMKAGHGGARRDEAHVDAGG